MMTFSTAILAALLLSSTEAIEASAKPAPGTPEIEEPYSPPPGSKEEQELWHRSVDAARLLHAGRAETARLQQRYKFKRTDEALTARGRAAGDAGEVVRAAQARARKAFQAGVDFLRAQWPVDPVRVCQYPTMDYESQLHNPDPKGREARIAPVRHALKSCVDRAEGTLRKLRAVNDELRAAITEAEQLGGTAGAAAPAAAVPEAIGGRHDEDRRERHHEKHEHKEKHDTKHGEDTK